MEDQELEALRAKRMAEMQAKAVSTSKCSYDEKFMVEITHLSKHVSKKTTRIVKK